MPAPDDHHMPTTWTLSAACADTDPEIFFPVVGGSTTPAKKICATCPVQTPCLYYAIDNHLFFGVWGGLGEKDRRRVRRREHWGPATGSGHGGDHMCGMNGCPYRGPSEGALARHRVRHHNRKAAA